MTSRPGFPALVLSLSLLVPLTLASAAHAQKRSAPTVRVRHRQGPGDWSVAETANFRVYHHNRASLAERAATVAERTRGTLLRKWFGSSGGDWSTPCSLYLHDSAQDYSEETGAPPESPGHATIRAEGDRVLSRRIDLHGSGQELLAAVLPHEVTHVVIAGRFGNHQVPRWVDEGMAVLTEPRDRIDRHYRELPRLRRDGMLFAVEELVEMHDYPHPRYIGSFYGQSVSLVEMLTRQKGPQTFTRFVRDGLQIGYEESLRRHYDCTFRELEQNWRRHAFRRDTGTVVVAEE